MPFVQIKQPSEIIPSCVEFKYRLPDGESISTVAVTSKTTITRSVTSNVATIGTSSPHSLEVGHTVDIEGLADEAYNIRATVTDVPDTTHFRYSLTHADEVETADVDGRISRYGVTKVIIRDASGVDISSIMLKSAPVVSGTIIRAIIQGGADGVRYFETFYAWTEPTGYYLEEDVYIDVGET